MVRRSKQVQKTKRGKSRLQDREEKTQGAQQQNQSKVVAKKPQRKERVSRTARADLQFSVSKIHRQTNMLKTDGLYVSKEFPVYAAAVLEFLASEVLESSGQIAKDSRKRRITPREIYLAVQSEKNLKALVGKNAIIPAGGVIPQINRFLLKQRGKNNEKVDKMNQYKELKVVD